MTIKSLDSLLGCAHATSLIFKWKWGQEEVPSPFLFFQKYTGRNYINSSYWYKLH